MYGGRGVGNPDALNGVYVLSLPGFVWHEAPHPQSAFREHHACITVKNQMISIGGHTGDNKRDHLGRVDVTPDPWPNGIGIFDMTNLSWGIQYNAEAPPYATPQLIRDWYNQG